MIQEVQCAAASCPVCTQLVVYLSCHMRNVHEVSDAESRHIN